MTKQITFEFEELPLLIEGGFSAGLVNGQAIINYWDDGLYGVAAIYLDGHKRKTRQEIADQDASGAKPVRLWHERLVPLDRGIPLFAMIHDRLETEWREKVLDAIRDEVEQAVA